MKEETNNLYSQLTQTLSAYYFLSEDDSSLLGFSVDTPSPPTAKPLPPPQTLRAKQGRARSTCDW